MDATPVANKKAPYKRRMTEKRRDQNRAAQRIYRARRKERLEYLERVVITPDKAIVASQQRGDDPIQTSATVSSSIDAQSTPSVPFGSSSAPDKRAPAKATSSSSDNTTVTALRKVLRVGESDDADELLEFAITKQPDLSTIVLAGLRALKSKESDKEAAPNIAPASNSTPEVGTPHDGTIPRTSLEVVNFVALLPDPLALGIHLRPQPTLEVFYQNSRALGLQYEQVTGPGRQSPWYSSLESSSSFVISLRNVPPDLYPTPAQISIPHHPFMDLIPFPWLRERAISLAALDPPAYDRWELKTDILAGGMVCWKSRAREEGQPWDRRSWEVQPWFWKKWGWMVEEQGKVEQQSRWWRSLRGE